MEKLHQTPLTSQQELKAQANSSSDLLPDWITSLPSPKRHSQPTGAPRCCTQRVDPLLPLPTQRAPGALGSTNEHPNPPFFSPRRNTLNPKMWEFLLPWVAGAILAGLGKDFTLGRPLWVAEALPLLLLWGAGPGAPRS